MKTKIVVVTAMFALAGLLTTGTLVANARQNGGMRPGWGNGDQNHVHTGPPGQSVVPHVNGNGNGNGRGHGHN